MDIDAMIAEVKNPVAAQEQPAEEAVVDSTEAANEEQTQEAPKELTPAEELEKLRKAKDRDNRRFGKLTAIKYQQAKENEELRAKLAAYESKQAPQKTPDGRPDVNDFDNHIDYLEAVQDWKLDQREAKSKDANNAGREEQFIQQRISELEQNEVEFAKTYPDSKSIAEEYSGVVGDFPENIRLTILKSENPLLALYNMAKSGVLDELGDMSLEDARVEIKLAQRQPKQEVKTVSTAPKPMSALKGNTSTKSIKGMTGEEILKWANS